MKSCRSGLILFPWLICCASLAQSLAPQDSSQISALNDSAYKYLAFQPEKALELANEALILSRLKNFKFEEAIALNRLAEYEFRKSNYARSIELATQSLRLGEEINNPKAMAMAYRVLGNTNTFGLKRYEVALTYQLKAYEILQKLNDVQGIASFCGNVTWIYAITNQNLNEAHALAEKGIMLSDSLGNLQLLAFNYNSKGLLFKSQLLFDSATHYLNLSNTYGEKAQDHAVIAYNKSILADIFLQRGETSKALQLFLQALKESQALQIREVVKDTYFGLSKCYERNKNIPEAFHYFKMYTSLRDSLVNWETTQKSLLAELEFKEAEQQAKINQLERANLQAIQEKRITVIMFGIISISLVTVIALIVRNNRQRNKMLRVVQEKSKEIKDQNLQLKEANQFKDKLFSIIGHDLRSPLVSLQSLLTLISSQQLNEQEFKNLVPKINQLVVASNETLENLLHWSYSQINGWEPQPKTLSLFHLTSNCVNLFIAAAKAKNIQLQNSIPHDITVFADKDHVELILRNLLNNAIKFTNENGLIVVTAHTVGNQVELVIKDTGIGMTEDQIKHILNSNEYPSTRGTKGEKGTGLGLQLCKEMAELNGGSLTINSKPGNGSEFFVTLTNAPY